MRQLLIKKGEILIEDVPAPIIDKNSVLVEVRYSLISAGTDKADIYSSSESIIQKTLKKPENIKKAIQMAQNQGISQAIAEVRHRLNTIHPIGNSISGIVIDIGKNIQDIKIGDHVACAGSSKANHAEIVCVPRKLTVNIPNNLDLKYAASVTLGAIAMQGVRRADPHFGEIVAVIGLGLIGQITVQILKAAGCYVIGIDISKFRVELAQKLGMEYAIISKEEDPVAAVRIFSSGHGADSTIITAATKSDLLVNQALEMTRKKGKVVVVGDIGLNINREPFYERELDFLISTSYGPGRYDETYEERGLDYPYAYVRWTENRNMQEYINMLARFKINFNALISKEYPFEEAEKAYQHLNELEDAPPSVLLKYSESCGAKSHERKIEVAQKSETGRMKTDIINVAIIGAGSFAKTIHLPNLKKLSKLFNIHAIVSNKGSNAKETAKRFGANYCSTNYRDVLQDKKVDAVLICTRHNLHSPMTIESLKAGKHVFIEKPLCLNQRELDQILEIYDYSRLTSHTPPILMVGFNRRFSPYAGYIRKLVKNRFNPMIINYRMNAGYIPLDHWIHKEEGGGRNIGEACHIYDLFNFFTDTEVESVDTKAVNIKTKQYIPNDNFIATIKYKDGSVCILTYTSLGSKDYPKEEMEVYVDGKILKLVDYKKLDNFGAKNKRIKTKRDLKGHLTELKAFYDSIQSGRGVIPFWQIVQATEISFKVEKLLFRG